MRYVPLVALVLAWLPAISFAQQQTHVSVKLVLDHVSVEPGASLLVGVFFEIEPEWHIYWKNPGEAGMATSVIWTVPEGFSVSEIMWPTPKRFMQDGDIEGFGYESSALLMVRVTPPPGFSGSADIKAQVKWLACKQVCVPGQSSLSKTVDFGTVGRPANRETFDEWLKRVPMDLGTSPMKISVVRRGLVYQLTVSGAPNDAELRVFVAPPDGVTVRRVERSGDMATVEFARLAGFNVVGKAEIVLQKNDVSVRVAVSLE